MYLQTGVSSLCFCSLKAELAKLAERCLIKTFLSLFAPVPVRAHSFWTSVTLLFLSSTWHVTITPHHLQFLALYKPSILLQFSRCFFKEPAGEVTEILLIQVLWQGYICPRHSECNEPMLTSVCEGNIKKTLKYSGYTLFYVVLFGLDFQYVSRCWPRI